MRTIVGVIFLGFQVFMIGYARYTPARYFCWAPFDMHTAYRLDVTVNGRHLTADEVLARYRRPSDSTDHRSPQHLIDILSGYEKTYGRNDRTQIIMTYRINGKGEQQWRWPLQ